MKKLLSVVVLALVAVFAASVMAGTPAPTSGEKTFAEKAKETCTAKGLTGAKLDECVNAEVKKLENEQAKAGK